MENRGKIVAIVAAGGMGVRAESAQPKQFASIRGVPLFVRALTTLALSPQISGVVVAVHPQRQAQSVDILNHAAESPGFSALRAVRVLPAGKESRAQTVAAAVRESCEDGDWALVHDAARPFLSAGLLSRIVDAALSDGVGAAPLLPLSEALKKIDDRGQIAEDIPRAGLFFAQTPQMFRAGLLKKALAQNPKVGDECEAMRRAGFQFQTVRGDPRNVKVTFPADFQMAEALADSMANSNFTPDSDSTFDSESASEAAA